MGVMESVRATEEAGRLVITPSPVLLDGQKNVAADLIPGESLYAFLARHVDPSEPWEVRIGGVVVPVEMWAHVKPKHGQIIEVRGAVNRQAVMLVAMVALTYFTFGAGATAGGIFGSATGAGTFFGMSAGVGATMAATATYMVGAALVNKVLGPDMGKPQSQSRDSVYSVGAARNAARPYEPIALLLGRTRITPDYASAPYTWYEGDDMYLGMVLNVGINVQDVGEIYNADTVLTSYEGVQVYYSGIPGKPNQAIPLYSNADTIDGGALDKSTAWVQRTTPPDTVRVQVNIEGSIGDRDSKGRDYRNSETIQAQYRPVGSTSWIPLTSRVISNDNDKNFEVQRVTMSRDLPRGQYEVRVRRLYTAGDPDKGNWSAASEFQWTNMVAVQADEADYAGMGRIGIRVKATGQLTGAMDQLRLEAWSKPVPVWTGSAWVTESTSNPGALALQFLRGIKDENGRLIAGVGLTDAEIDIPSLQAFMVHCEANNYTYDHYLTETRSNGDQLDAILRAGFGALSWETGKLGVVWAADGQPVSGVVNMATIKRGTFQVDYTLHNAADGIEATYFDRTDWSVKTLRVEAPGVTTMLNPAQVQLEGVTTEEHAAQLARWHLAQSLYQYKDITYSTDLEHLAYKRMDVLQLQHDLTQWGYGGRLVSVSGSTVTLDEPVPPSATAHIGVRVPGEAVYRIMRVANFTGEPRDTVTLLDAWPSDAPLPTAETEQDYIWIYDFKATPGYRVRVVGKTLESDAKGASVAVVPESPEFWTYVKTGEYTPPKGGSLLNTLPKASNVRVSEVQVVTGDVIHTELSVLFDIKGQAARSVVFAGITGTEIRPVAETVTNQVRFRIGSAGTYTILVRPYSVDGIAGEAASTTYTTVGADIPPPPFDWFTVTVEPGGLRRYAWGYNQFQPADLAGAEIRFSAEEGTPAWEAMTPIGEDGFFTSAFESDIPASGDWTFAIRARNTSGELSTPIYTHETLTHNVGENIGDLEERTQTTWELAQEMLSDFAAMNQRIADVQAEAQQAADALRGDLDDLTNQVASLLGSEEWDETKDYTAGAPVKHEGGLYVAKQDVPAGTPVTDNAYWQYVGEYNSVADAVAAVVQQSDANATEIDAHAAVLAALGAMTPDGTAFVLDTDKVQVAPGESLAQRLSGISAAFGDANARIDAEELARSSADDALSQRTQAMESRMPTGTGDLATAQSVTQVTNRVSTVEGTVSTHSGQISANTAAIEGKANSSTVTALSNTVTQQGDTLTAHGTQLSGLSATVGGNSASINELREVTANALTGNALVNPSFETAAGWGTSPSGEGGLPSGFSLYVTSGARSGNRALRINAGSGTRTVYNGAMLEVRTGQVIRLGFFYRRISSGLPDGWVRVAIRKYDQSQNIISFDSTSAITGYGATSYQSADGAYIVESGVRYISMALQSNTTSGDWLVDDAFMEPQSNGLTEVMAKYGLAVQAGGDVAGMQLLAGGGISAIRFLANMFSIVNPGGTNGWEFDGATGRQVTRGGSYMKVEGAPFGVGNAFLFWMGPNLSDIAQCSTANAMFALMTNGNMFINGAIINGMIEKTTSTSQLGPVPTLGNDIFVDASLRGSNMVTSNVQQQGALQVRGSTTFPVTLQRRIGSGSWQTVATTTGSSSWSEITNVDGVDQATASGGITPFEYVDDDPSLSDRYYRLVRGTATGAVEYRRGLSGSWINAGLPSNYRIKSSEVAG